MLAASAITSSVLLTVPAHADDAQPKIDFTGLTTVEVGGGWSEGLVTVTNPTDKDVTGDHLYFDSGSVFSAEYADGADGAWKPLAVNLPGARPGRPVS